jgi:RND family efflux transporter MFP subunit
MRQRWWIVLLPLLVALPGCNTHGDAAAPDDEAKTKKDTEAHVTVRTEPARMGTLTETAEGLGRIEALPDHIATLTPAVEGHVHKLVVTQGDPVKKGQPIVELDEAVAQSDLEEKTAIRDGLKASLALLKSLPRPEERRPSELAAEQARVAVERAAGELESLRSLSGNNLTSRQQIFIAEKVLEAARVQQQLAEATVRAMMIGPRTEAVAEAEGKIKTAAAVMSLSKVRLEYHTIRAPIDGVLDSLTCRPGQTIAIGSPIGEVVDTHQVFAAIWLPTQRASPVRVGQQSRVLPSDAAASAPGSHPSESDAMTGKVAFVGRVADPQTGNLPIRVAVDNPQGRLTIGQSIRVSIVMAEHKDALQVPAAAILDLGEGPVLSVVRDGKVAVLHPEVGAAHEGWTQVSGTDLKAGEPVIVEGGYNLAADTLVKVAEEAKEEAKEKGAKEDGAKEKGAKEDGGKEKGAKEDGAKEKGAGAESEK